MKEEKLRYYIEKCSLKYDNKYSYNGINPRNCKEEFELKCPIHGVFKTTFDLHLYSGKECPLCGKGKRYNNESFINKLKEIYSDKYTYNKTIFKRMNDKVIATCPIHGDFSVRASHFLNQLCQCPKCGKHKYTKNEFIEKANIIHNSKYDYSKIEYINNHTKVSIICPIHGEFRQTPSAHLNGNACPKCNGGCVMTKEEFVEKSQQIHGNKYCYNNVEYINSKTTVKIICNKHGVFEQMPMLHLKGCGCPKCKSSKLEQMIIVQLDKHNIEYIPQYRVKSLNEHIFDFYLPKYKIIIECQGEQHYHPVNFRNHFNGEELLNSFNKRIKLDEEKYEFCLNNNLDILYFTKPKMFLKKNIDVFDGFYKNKNVFINAKTLIDYVLNRPTI